MPRKPHTNAAKANTLNDRRIKWILGDPKRWANYDKKLNKRMMESYKKRVNETMTDFDIRYFLTTTPRTA